MFLKFMIQVIINYIFDSNNNILVLASEKEAKTSEDKIIMIEKDSGNITELVDLIDLLPDYYSTTSLPDGAEDLDWMHINSLSLVDKTSLIISSRETSTIIKLDNIYSNPTIDYMIGLRTVLPDAKIVNFEDDGEGIIKADLVFNALLARKWIWFLTLK